MAIVQAELFLVVSAQKKAVVLIEILSNMVSHRRAENHSAIKITKFATKNQKPLDFFNLWCYNILGFRKKN